MDSYCLRCRKHTSGSFVRQGTTSRGRGYSIFKCKKCGTNKSVFNKGKGQKGGIVSTYTYYGGAEPLPNNGYKGLTPFLAAYSAANKVKRLQKGHGFDIQKWIAKSGIEFHPPGYQFLGPGTHLEYRLAKGQKGINILDKIARKHDIAYADASSDIKKKWKADDEMVKAIDNLPGKQSWLEFASRHGINIKKNLEQFFH